MSAAQSRLHGLRRAAQRRELAALAGITLPLALGLAAVGWRFGGIAAASIVAVLVAIIGIAAAAQRVRRYDAHWLARSLNTACPQLDDSAALLLIPQSAELNALEQLQQARLQARLQALALPDLRRPWPVRGLVAAWTGGLALSLAAIYVPAPSSLAPAAATPTNTAAVTHTTLQATTLTITPPAYTRLSPRKESALEAKVPAGSRLRWSLRLQPQPDAVALSFHDGSRLTLQREGDTWRGERVLDVSMLYRLELQGAPPLAGERAWRIDVVADAAPEVIVHSPEKTLDVLSEEQKTWELSFEARDDYGLASAELSLTRAQGSGENIEVSEQTLVLDGDGDARQRRYRKSIDLAALGYARGDDLIARLTVSDNREPQPNRTRSASFILRWPAEEAAESTGMEGIVRQSAPAYFRSQRQIIIDTEALLQARAELADSKFEQRSDTIGVDQKLLRLRYGQFLGEEFESNAEKAPPASEHESEHAAEAPSHEHDTESAGAAPGFGADNNAAAEYGHVHDIKEAATLLDPETRRILKAALDEMWQAELQLRLAKPEAALPYEYRALEYIKQVQQASRIYLARSGLDLPQIDPARRLSGERAGLSDRSETLSAAQSDAAPVAALWQALEQDRAPDWPAFLAWIRAHQATLPDALGVLAAADRLRSEPQCVQCKHKLQALLWPLLPLPATTIAPRTEADAAGAAWLDALSGSRP